MGKTYKDKPAKEREIAIKKAERGSHRRMEPYKREKNWDNPE
jgi:hypothetical protein